MHGSIDRPDIQIIPVPYEDEVLFIETDGITSIFRPEAGTTICWTPQKLKISLSMNPDEDMRFSGSVIHTPSAEMPLVERMQFVSQLPMDATDMTTVLALLAAPAISEGIISFPDLRIHNQLGRNLRTAFEDVIYGLPVDPNAINIYDREKVAYQAMEQASRAIAQQIVAMRYAVDCGQKEYTHFLIDNTPTGDLSS